MISASQLIRLIADAKHFGYDYQFSIEDNVYDNVYVVSFQHSDYEKPFVIAFDDFGQPYHQYGLTREDFHYYRDHFDDLYAEEERQKAEEEKQKKIKLIEQLNLTKEQIQMLGISL